MLAALKRWKPPSFSKIARGVLFFFGTAALTIGLLGLMGAAATSIAAPALVPTTAVWASTISLGGGGLMVGWTWVVNIANERFFMELLKHARPALAEATPNATSGPNLKTVK